MQSNENAAGVCVYQSVKTGLKDGQVTEDHQTFHLTFCHFDLAASFLSLRETLTPALLYPPSQLVRAALKELQLTATLNLSSTPTKTISHFQPRLESLDFKERLFKGLHTRSPCFSSPGSFVSSSLAHLADGQRDQRKRSGWRRSPREELHHGPISGGVNGYHHGQKWYFCPRWHWFVGWPWACEMWIKRHSGCQQYKISADFLATQQWNRKRVVLSGE